MCTLLMQRCGKNVYYISYPLSILDPNEPIVQATVLATFYEDLCNDGCQKNNEEHQNSSDEIKADDKQGSKILPFDNLRNRTGREENVGETIQNEKQEKTDLKLELNHTDINSPINLSINKESNNKEFYLDKGEILKTHNSTFNVSDILDNYTENESDNLNNNQRNSSYLFFSPWRLFKFFLTKSGTFNYNFTDYQNLTSPIIHLNQNENRSTITNGTLISNQNLNLLKSLNAPAINNSKVVNLSSIKVTTNSMKPSENYLTNTSTINEPIGVKTNKCTQFPELNCSEFSVDKMLLARLCCLDSNKNNILSGERGSDFTCKKFDKDDCDKLFPIIKCCSKGLSELVDDYLARNGNLNGNNASNQN